MLSCSFLFWRSVPSRREERSRHTRLARWLLLFSNCSNWYCFSTVIFSFLFAPRAVISPLIRFFPPLCLYSLGLGIVPSLHSRISSFATCCLFVGSDLPTICQQRRNACAPHRSRRPTSFKLRQVASAYPAIHPHPVPSTASASASARPAQRKDQHGSPRPSKKDDRPSPPG